MFLFEFFVEIGAEFGVLALDVDGNPEDGSGIDKALGEDAEDRLVDLTGGRTTKPATARRNPPISMAIAEVIWMFSLVSLVMMIRIELVIILSFKSYE